MTAPAYAVARLKDVEFGDDVVAYMREIDATLAPFGGEFVIHGGALTAVEGEWHGDLVMIRFPDRAAADGWYASPAYQAILPLRTRHSTGIVAIVDGVAPGHTAAKRVEELLAGQGLATQSTSVQPMLGFPRTTT